MPPTEITLPQMPTPYKVGAGPVTLDVTVGEKQKGFAKVWIEGKAEAIGEGPQITGLGIGNGGDIAAKTLEVLTTVSVINKNSNRTVVTYTLKGGASTRTFTSEHTATKIGDVVEYTADFLFEA